MRDRVYHVGVTTDCSDTNATGRLSRRCAGLFGIPPQIATIPPGLPGLVEAGYNLMDCLLAHNNPRRLAPPVDKYAVDLLNAAPRGGVDGHDNGVPFCYFWQGQILVVSTLTPELFHLSRRLGLMPPSVHLLDIPEVLEWAQENNILSAAEASEITNSQFRSLEFEPLAARLLLQYGSNVPSQSTLLDDPPPAQGTVVGIDNFGNIKLDCTAADLKLAPFMPRTCRPTGSQQPTKPTLVHLTTLGISVPFYTRLADVPPRQLALVESSSGPYDSRLLMLCISGLDGQSAAETTGLQVDERALDLKLLCAS